MNQSFVNARVDGHSTDGGALAKRFHVTGYPTLLVVDEKGGEIDRIVGCLQPDKFLPEGQRIGRGEGTLPALRKKVEANPDDLEAKVKLAERQEESDPGSMTSTFEDIAKRAKEKGLKEVEAKATWLPML